MKLKKFFSSNIREISLIIVMIALSLFIEIRSGGNFFTLENISDMFTETAVLAITAVGMMMVIITSGIDLSIGSIMALGAMVGGTILKNNQAVPGVAIILVSIAVGIVCGFINGTLVAKLKILPIIATLGMMNIYRGLTYLVANGSWIKQQEMGTKFLSIATGKFLGINNLIVVAIVVYIIAAFFLNKTRTGRKIYAVGNSEESARVSGIKTDRTLIMVYTILGAVPCNQIICDAVAHIAFCPFRNIRKAAKAAVKGAVRFKLLGICDNSSEQRRHLRPCQPLLQHHVAGLVAQHNAGFTQIGGSRLLRTFFGGKRSYC